MVVYGVFYPEYPAHYQYGKGVDGQLIKLTKIQKALQVLTEDDDKTEPKKKAEKTWWTMLSAGIITLEDFKGAREIIQVTFDNCRECPIFRRYIRKSVKASLKVGTEGKGHRANFFLARLLTVIYVFLFVKLVLDICNGLGCFGAVFLFIPVEVAFIACKHNWKQTSIALRRGIYNLGVMIETGELEAMERAGTITVMVFANKIQAAQAAEEKARREAEDAERAKQAAAKSANEDAEQQAKIDEFARNITAVVTQFTASMQSSQSAPAQTQQSQAANQSASAPTP